MHIERVLFIYKHKKNGDIQALMGDASLIFDMSFDRPNWIHTATVDAVMFVKALISSPKCIRNKMIDDLIQYNDHNKSTIKQVLATHEKQTKAKQRIPRPKTKHKSHTGTLQSRRSRPGNKQTIAHRSEILSRNSTQTRTNLEKVKRAQTP